MLRDAGAKEVHMRIASPPTQWPCYYGVDTPTRSELIASTHSVEEVNQYITSDTLAYLSLDSLTKSVMKSRTQASIAAQLSAQEAANAAISQTPSDQGTPKRRLPVRNHEVTEKSFCHACWSGDYPIDFTPTEKKQQLPLLHV
jgi:amidophosphoribosyltransferase